MRARSWPVGLVLSLALSACGAASDGNDARPTVFSPDPELADVTRQWAERWSAASGLDVRVEEGGIPVLAVDDVAWADGTVWCGATFQVMRGTRWLGAQAIQVDLTPPDGCVGWGYTVGHEMAHALGALDHAESGLLANSPALGVIHVIDEAALELLCINVECPAFNPEEPQ